MKAIRLVLYYRIGGARSGYLQVIPKLLKVQIDLPARGSPIIPVPQREFLRTTGKRAYRSLF